MRKNDWKKRGLSLLMAVMMVLSMIPNGALPTRAVSAEESDKVADPSTLDSWKQFFNMDSLSTQNAGMVWTDKSVLTEVPDSLKGLQDLDTAQGVKTDITMDSTKEDNFLVALSVMASNKTITGYASVPTDTVFVLDLSSSMRTNDDRGGSAIDELVEATNEAITRLLELNRNNRVGVVLYAGNTAGSWNTADAAVMAILPLDHYTAGDNGNFLVSANRKSGNSTYTDQRVEVAKNVKNSSGTTVSGGMDTSTGTFTQAGIMGAIKQFLAADTVVENDKIQGGTVRKPILVLMSDGEPTLGHNDFSNVGQSIIPYSNTSNGNTQQGNRNAIAFLTQLTSMYANAVVEDHYGQDMLFYTLTYGDAATNRAEAMSVMNPAVTSAELNTMWNTLQSAAGRVQVYKHGRGNNDVYYAVRNEFVEEGNPSFEGRVYVDKFYPANSDLDFSQAFKDLVNEIVIQSRYTPTLVQSGQHDLDGYVSFVDHIGEHMEVTDIKGMVIGNSFMSGAAFSDYIVNGKGGTLDNPSDLGNEFIRSVKERLGIADTGTAQALVHQAFTHGQISYTSNTEFSNYIGWYSDASGKFLGFWHKDITTEIPAGATHINRSYGFLGEVDEEQGVRASDMMYTTVRIREEIATGDVTLAWAIPSALIPTVEYKVELDGNYYDSEMTSISATGATNGPIRLIFEVALNEQIHSYNVNEIIGNVPGHKDHYNQETGEYTFYTNDWVANDNTNPINTYAYFEASKENERYYYVSDAVIYTDAQGKTPYTGTTAPSGGTYYHEYYVYSEANGTQRKMEKISANVLALAVKSGDNWIVPKGTQYHMLEDRDRVKTQNSTGTMPYVVEALSVDEGTYHCATVLGNNGKLTFTPDTGIKITKTLAETVENGVTEFTFVIAGGTGTATLIRPGANADGSDKTETLTFTDGKASFTVAADETVYIVDLEAGKTYTVTESGNADYAVQTITVGGEVQDSAVITAVEGQVEKVDFVNAPKGYGNLNITKEIVAAEGHVVPEAISRNREFELTITLADLANQTFQIVHSGNAELTEVTTDGECKFTVKLKHGETIQVLKILENTLVTVTESDPGENFVITYRTRDFSGAEADNDNMVTIGKDVNSTAVVMNTYTPKSTTVDLNVEGSKKFANGTGAEQTFNFKVQQWNGTAWVDIAGKTGSVTYAAAETAEMEKTFSIENVLEGISFDKPGEYAYQIVEVIPSDRVDGITYDRATHTITVKVEDVNGQLTASVVTHNANITPDAEGTFVVTPAFQNYYYYDIVSLDITKELINASGSDKVNRSGFEFVLMEGETVVAREYSDAAGEARIVLVYNNTQLGTHTYTLKEIKPTTGAIQGMTYTVTEYQITVKVEAKADGTVEATIDSITAVNQNPSESAPVTNEAKDNADLKFANMYDPADAEVMLKANKNLNGRTLKEEEFSFEVRKDGTTEVVATGKNAADGTVTFSKLTFDKVGTYKYDVVEVAGNLGGVSYDSTIYDLVVEVTDGGEGKLVTTYYFEDAVGQVVTFNNTYTTKPTSLTLGGNKTLIGRTLLATEFTFELKDSDGNAIQSVQNAGANADGVFTFAPITFTKPGTYTYTISEVKGNLTGLTYATDVYDVVVVVIDDGEGNLIAKIGDQPVTEKKDYTFQNTYTPSETAVEIAGTKVLTGKDLAAGDYTFALYSESGTLLDTASNEADGTFVFNALSFNQTGTFKYKVREFLGAEQGMTYDSTVYDVTVTIGYDQDAGRFTSNVAVSGNGTLVFTNAYVAPAVVPVAGEKTLIDSEGNAVAFDAGDFTFAIIDAEGNVVETVSNDADGKFAFEDLVFWTSGRYVYTVVETKGEDTAFVYDATVYHVHVDVVLNDEGTALVPTVTIGVPDQEHDHDVNIVFNNIVREPVTVHLQAVKTLAGRVLKDQEFSFVLKDASGNVVETVKNDANGNVNFKALSFDKAGEYKYTISEVAGNDAYMVYDAKVYEVTITVTVPEQMGEYADGPYVAEVTYEGGKVPTFENTPKKDVPMSFSFLKVDEAGKALAGAEFTLTHVNCGGCSEEIGSFTAVSDGNGVVKFENIPSGHQYILRESKTPANYKPAADRHVTDVYGVVYIDGEAANGSDLIKVVNVAAGHTEIILKGIKYLKDAEGKDITATNGAYAFELYAKEGDSYKLIDTQYNMATAETTQTVEVYSEFIFRSIPVTQVGTYEYLIREVKGSDPDVVYDTTEYQVVVTVEQDENHDLKITGTTVNGGAGTISFTNVQRAPVTGTVSADKTVKGGELREGAFIFHLKNEAGEILQSKRNDAEGKVTFETLTFEKAGTYVYTVSEQAGNNVYMDYDPAVYTVSFKVEPDGNGYKVTRSITREGAAAEEISFVNEIHDRGVGMLDLKKVNENGEAMAGVEFTLSHKADCCDAEIEAMVAVSREDGLVILDHIPSGHSYILSESKTPEHYTKIDDMEVTVTFGKTYVNGELVESGVALTVVNHYNGKTGIRGKKTLEGRQLAAGEFSFALYQADRNFAIEGTPIQTVTNGSDGSFSFDAIEYSAVGTYYYVVKEVEGDLDNITYDKSQYRITVVVTKNTSGELIPEISVQKTAGETPAVLNSGNQGDIVLSDILEFKNIYTPDPVSVELEGIKTLAGRDLAAGEFEFELVDAAGKVLQTVKNAADGSFKFEGIEYAEATTQTFTVREVKGTLADVVYDETVYTVTVTVTKDEVSGKLSAKTEISNGGALSFSNIYNNPGDLVLSGVKTLDGAAPADGAYSFVLLDAQGNVLDTVTNSGSSFSFKKLSFNAVGEYVYIVRETRGNDLGVIYDETEYHIHVTVTLNEQTHKFEVSYSVGIPTDDHSHKGSGEIHFSNVSREPVTVHLQAVKTLAGRVLKDQEFSFVLKDASGNVVETVKNDANGNVNFKALSFDKAGEYKYTISEVAGNDAYMVYDAKVYEVTITVTVPEQMGEYADGPYVAEVTYEGGKVPTFENTPKKDVPMSFSFLKVDEAGKALAGAEFTLTHVNCGGCSEEIGSFTAVSDGNGVVKFENIPSGHQYILRESKTPANYKPAADRHVTDVYGVVYIDGEAANGSDLIKVVNVAAGHTEIILKGIKYLKDAEGKDITATNGAYAFELYAKEGDSYKLIDTQYNMATAETTQTVEVYSEFIFRSIPVTQVGTYEYLIREVKGSDPDVVYDTTEYQVVVTVEQDENHDLKITGTTVNGGAGTISFTNVQRAPVTGTVSADKTVKGGELREGAFIFHLKNEAGEILQSKRNDAEGKVTFETLTFEKAGTYVYTVSEQAGNNVYMDYDPAVYTVSFKVEPDGNGYKVTRSITREGAAAEEISFVNEIHDRGVGMLDLKKVNENGEAMAGVEFTLSHKADCCDAEIEAMVAVSREDGLVILDHIPSGHSYILSESKTPEHYTKIDDMEVTVTFGKTYVNGELVESGVALTVVNHYNGKTGIRGKKTLEGRQLAAGEFSFALYQADRNFAIEGTPIQTVTNGSDGSFSFDAIEYSAVGTYYYVVKEVEGDLDNITYDKSQYRITVVVTKNTSGELIPEISVQKTAGETPAVLNSGNQGDIVLSDILEFKNIYTPDPVSVELEGIKTLAGRDLAAGEFEFELVDAAGKVLQTVKNAADGSFKFEGIEYAETGTYTYVVREVSGDLVNVVYDITAYTVTVEITKDAVTGVLSKQVTVDNGGELIFKNVYNPDAVSVKIGATKTLIGRDLKAGEFEFILTQEGNPFSVITRNDADGNIQFNLVFAEVGEYHYTVREKTGSDGQMTYDDAVYYFTVVVTNPGDGELDVLVTFTDETRTAEVSIVDMVFNNIYTPEPVSVKLDGTKTLIGKDLEQNEFSFQLKDEDGNVLQTVMNEADGSFTFENIEFEEEGTYTFTVEEVKGDDDKVSYDETVYTVTVEVTNQNGILVAEVIIDNGGKLAFSNTYTHATPENIRVPIVIRKVLVNKSDRIMTSAGFRFVMTDRTGRTQYAVSGVTGSAGFVLNYSEEDVGKTFVYTVTEVDTGIEGMEYSKMVYTIWVTITLDEESNELVAQVSVNGVPMSPAVLTFVNTYEPEIPEEPTEPEPTEPEPTEPEPTEPEPTEPEPTEPEPTEPEPTEPEPTEPEPTEPEPTEPKPTEPEPTEPESTEPKPTEPESTEPKPTEPKPTEPKPTKPGNDDVPETGDDSNVVLWSMLLCFSAFGLFILKAFKRKGRYSA